MSERIEFTSPVGRLVAGDLWTARTEDFQGNPLTVKTGPNQGQPRQEYFVGLAIPKNHPEWPAFHALIVQAARQGFPNLFDAAGNCQRSDFAFKVTDGDSTVMNRNNSRPCDKEGYPGNWVVSMSTSLGIKVVDQSLKPILPETKAVKRGDYIRIAGSIAPNGNATNPGVFINPSFAQFSHQGDEIVSGPDAATVFGANPLPSAPAGAVTTPGPSLQPISAPANVGNPTASTATAPGISTPSPVSAPAPVAPVSAPANVAPAHDFLNPQPPTAPVAPAPVVEQFLINGSVYSRDALRAAGWTDVQIDAQQRA